MTADLETPEPDYEKRIMQVSDLLTDRLVASMLRQYEQQEPLWDALEVLVPEVKELAKHESEDPVIENLHSCRTQAAYVIGIVAGLRLADRYDLVGKFAKAYADLPLTPELP